MPRKTSAILAWMAYVISDPHIDLKATKKNGGKRMVSIDTHSGRLFHSSGSRQRIIFGDNMVISCAKSNDF
jgi:hypothetical protein